VIRSSREATALGSSVVSMSPPTPLPAEFGQHVENLRHMAYRAELTVREAPAPARLAPHGFAQTVDIEVDDEAIGSGRLVILHDPDGQPSWEGTTRVIAYVDADVDLEVASDPMLTDVGWSWLTESLEQAQADAGALGGTVTRTSSRSFGVMSERPPEGRLQVRASWTPAPDQDLTAHANAWALLIAAACGLPPLSPGVAAIAPRPPRN